MNPFSGVLQYLKIFLHHVGRRLYLVFALTAVAGVAEGLGIALMLPLLAALDVGGDMQGTAPQTLLALVSGLGIEGSLVGILVLIGIIFLGKAVIQFASTAYAGYLEAQLLRELRERLFDAYGRMGYLYYAQKDTGHFVNVINGQVGNFYTSFSSFVGFVTRVIMAAAYMGMALFLAWQFGLMAIGIGVLQLLLFRRINLYVRELSRQTSQESSRLNKLLVQSLQSFKYLVSTNKVESVRADVMSSIWALTTQRFRQKVALAFTGSMQEPFSVFFVILLVILQVVVLGQPITPILVAILLFHRGVHSMVGIQNWWQTMLNTIGSVEMVRDELDALERHREINGRIKVGPLSRGIDLRDVQFAYGAGQEEVLQSISLAIPARTTVAFVGESGAGKSTLVDMLTLLPKPSMGEVRIDGVSGQDIELTSWRSQIGYVSQEPMVFDDTVAANIAMCKVDPKSEPEVLQKVQRAAACAHIAHFIEELPLGYQTIVGDRGIRLSGGQRQRLCIARELFKEPNLLILDEATSALDTESERAIQDSIDALRGEMTVVIIAHRLSTIKNVDCIYVLDRGQIIEGGAYEELRERHDSHFRSMVEMQAL